MIRNRNKVFAEINDPDTITYDDEGYIDDQRFAMGAGWKKIMTTGYLHEPNRLMILGPGGTLTSLSYRRNVFIGTDEDGNIVLVDKGEIA